MWWILAALLVGWLVYPLFLGQSATPSIPYGSLLTQVDKGNVSDVLIQGDQISGTLDQSASIKLTPDAQQPTEITHFKAGFPAEVGQQGLIQELRDQGATVNVQSAQPGLLSSFLISWLPFILIGVFVFWLVRRAAGRQSQIFDFGRSKARRVTAETTHVTFDDVPGFEDRQRAVVIAATNRPDVLGPGVVASRSFRPGGDGRPARPERAHGDTGDPHP